MIARIRLACGTVIDTNATPAEIREVAHPPPEPNYFLDIHVQPCVCGREWFVQPSPEWKPS